MSLAYFDASALVKLVIDEEGTEAAHAIWDQTDVGTSSRLAHPEVCAALAALHRRGALSEAQHRTARDRWSELWLTAWPLGLTEGIEQLAGDLAHSHALSGSDAVHLASALAVAADDFVMVVWDPRLHAGALAEGLAVLPATV